jgi:hypothetical protein
MPLLMDAYRGCVAFSRLDQVAKPDHTSWLTVPVSSCDERVNFAIPPQATCFEDDFREYF